MWSKTWSARRNKRFSKTWLCEESRKTCITLLATVHSFHRHKSIKSLDEKKKQKKENFAIIHNRSRRTKYTAGWSDSVVGLKITVLWIWTSEITNAGGTQFCCWPPIVHKTVVLVAMASDWRCSCVCCYGRTYEIWELMRSQFKIYVHSLCTYELVFEQFSLWNVCHHCINKHWESFGRNVWV